METGPWRGHWIDEPASDAGFVSAPPVGKQCVTIHGQSQELLGNPPVAWSERSRRDRSACCFSSFGSISRPGLTVTIATESNLLLKDSIRRREQGNSHFGRPRRGTRKWVGTIRNRFPQKARQYPTDLLGLSLYCFGDRRLTASSAMRAMWCPSVLSAERNRPRHRHPRRDCRQHVPAIHIIPWPTLRAGLPLCGPR